MVVACAAGAHLSSWTPPHGYGGGLRNAAMCGKNRGGDRADRWDGLTRERTSDHICFVVVLGFAFQQKGRDRVMLSK
jgi:hypothetical protein